MSNDDKWMGIALGQAEAAAVRDEVPVGAVIVDVVGREVARAGNRTRELNDPTGHAEILAIRAACAELGAERLWDCDLFVTLEPCAMCATAISFARIRRLVYGAGDPKMGGVAHGACIYEHSTCHHVPDIEGGLHADASADLMRRFFRAKRG